MAGFAALRRYLLGSPLIVKDMVVAGVSGGDWGIRGFVAAYKAASGEPGVWRRTGPFRKGNGDPGYDTWKGSAVTLRRRRHVADRLL